MKRALLMILLAGCGATMKVSEPSLPDSVALPPPMVPVFEVPETTTTEASPITSPATVAETAVRVSAPDPTTTTTIPAPQWVRFDCESFRYLLDRYGMPFDYFGKIVMPRESRCDPSAFYDGPEDLSYGLLQINTQCCWRSLKELCGITQREQLFDPEINIACGSKLYHQYGKTPWRV